MLIPHALPGEAEPLSAAELQRAATATMTTPDKEAETVVSQGGVSTAFRRDMELFRQKKERDEKEKNAPFDFRYWPFASSRMEME